MEAVAHKPSLDNFSKFMRKLLIGLICICSLTRLFIRVKLEHEGSRQRVQDDANLQLLLMIIKNKNVRGTRKFAVEPQLETLSLKQLLGRFDFEMFQNHMELAGVQFPKRVRRKRVAVVVRGSVRHVELRQFEKNELFALNKKRKDDMMSSLLKFIQRNVLNDFKATRDFKLVRNIKKEFKQEFFADDPDTEAVYYSTLFNRKQLLVFRNNAKLLEKIRLSFELGMLETLVHNYFLRKNAQQFFDARSERLFSGAFVKSLKKKQMTLGDALFAFYCIEDYIFGGIDDSG